MRAFLPSNKPIAPDRQKHCSCHIKELLLSYYKTSPVPLRQVPTHYLYILLSLFLFPPFSVTQRNHGAKNVSCHNNPEFFGMLFVFIPKKNYLCKINNNNCHQKKENGNERLCCGEAAGGLCPEH